MADVAPQRRYNFRRYSVRVFVGERQVWACWSELGIPKFILVAFRPNMKRCKGWVEHLDQDQRVKVLGERDTKLVVCRLNGIRSEPLDGSRCFKHVVDYEPLEPPPSILFMSEWRQWQRENDTQGDILSPRIDDAGQSFRPK